ncbi:PDC sensor domain-containing protein [Salidesulfovibrio brasiliensis]|uniref:PDC sensor domain-containing protein n=1 Tax=Salidesulfovibrio brasiliensis TaxID=221711 RepID=UPI0006D000C9|nr:cache domain-containing protein [Salidesulfovibrio brasiliensis]
MNFMNWSLRLKIIIPTFTVVLFVLAASTWLMTQNAQDLVVSQAVELADDKARGYSLEIKETLGSAMAVSRTIQSALNEAVQAEPVPRREYLEEFLKNVLKNHPELSGSWVACLPGRFDDREDEYRDVFKGTMRVYHYRDGDTIGTSYEGTNNLSGDWFDIPMSGTVETISKPYPWTVDGKTNWLASTGFPIQRDGENIGVAGVDFYLTDLQEIVTSIRPYETGYAILVANDGTIIAHPDSEMLGKNLGEVATRSTKGHISRPWQKESTTASALFLRQPKTSNTSQCRPSPLDTLPRRGALPWWCRLPR